MQRVSLLISIFFFLSWIAMASNNPYGDPTKKTKKSKTSSKSKEVVLKDEHGNALIMKNNNPSQHSTHPTHDYYIIEGKSPVNKVYEIHVYNIDGKKVAIYNAAGVSLKMIETTTFQKGLYLYHIIKDGKVLASGKLIV